MRKFFILLGCILMVSLALDVYASMFLLRKVNAAANYCDGSEPFCESFDLCSDGVEPDANCENTWSVGGEDVYLVDADGGYDGSGSCVYTEPNPQVAGQNLIASFDSDFTSSNTSIVMRFKTTLDDPNDYFRLYIRNDGDNVLYIRLDGSSGVDGRVQVFDSVDYHAISGMSYNTWYDLTISDINFTNHTADYDVTEVGGSSVGSLNDIGFYDDTHSALDQYWLVSQDTPDVGETLHIDRIRAQ